MRKHPPFFSTAKTGTKKVLSSHTRKVRENVNKKNSLYIPQKEKKGSQKCVLFFLGSRIELKRFEIFKQLRRHPLQLAHS
mmetsp:Transcript_33010/g.43995  ORF Transcript_33010/g.43995 Transcript_33010/m.43995 type:complete len:80 (+) Transcript_33010:36-275(+)